MSFQIKIRRWRFPRYRHVRWDKCVLSLGPVALLQIIKDHPDLQPRKAVGVIGKASFRFWPWFGNVVLRVAIVWVLIWLVSRYLRR